MSDLPEDLWRDIFIREPVVTLLQCKRVCKKWLNIIHDPNFKSLHFHRQTRDQQIIILDVRGGKLYTLPLNALGCAKQGTESSEANLVRPTGTRVRGLPLPSCHGLILLSHDNINKAWTLWNPLTRAILYLPPFNGIMRVNSNVKSSLFCGLGYDSVTNDFKVVRIAHESTGRQETLIYCLKLKKWRGIEVLTDCALQHWYGCFGVFVNGKLHWLASASDLDHETSNGLNCMLCFDIETGSHNLLRLPSAFNKSENRYTVYLDALGECLVMNWWSQHRGVVDVWVLKSYSGNNTWAKLFSFPTSLRYSYARPIAYLKNEDHVLMKHNLNEFMWVDVKNKCMKNVSVEGFTHYWPLQVIPGIEPDPLVYGPWVKKWKRKSLKLKITHSDGWVPCENWFD